MAFIYRFDCIQIWENNGITGQRLLSRVWRNQRDNQKPYIEEEQTTQWPKEKVQKDKQRSTRHTYKTKDRITRTPLKTGGELRIFDFWNFPDSEICFVFHCIVSLEGKSTHLQYNASWISISLLRLMKLWLYNKCDRRPVMCQTIINCIICRCSDICKHVTLSKILSPAIYMILLR